MADATTANPNQLTQDIGSILSLITGLTGNKDFKDIAKIADPWGPQRSQYQDQLNAFMKDPGSIFTDPAFQAAQRVGAENISRQAGAAGMGSSGNRLADLFSFGQSSALDFEKMKFNELSQLAGVNAGSPADAAKIIEDALKTQGTNLTTGITGLISSILSGLVPGAAGGLAGIIQKIIGGGDPSFNLTPGVDFDPSAGTSTPDPGQFIIPDPGGGGDIIIGGVGGA